MSGPQRGGQRVQRETNTLLVLVFCWLETPVKIQQFVALLIIVSLFMFLFCSVLNMEHIQTNKTKDMKDIFDAFILKAETNFPSFVEFCSTISCQCWYVYKTHFLVTHFIISSNLTFVPINVLIRFEGWRCVAPPPCSADCTLCVNVCVCPSSTDVDAAPTFYSAVKPGCTWQETTAAEFKCRNQDFMDQTEEMFNVFL